MTADTPDDAQNAWLDAALADLDPPHIPIDVSHRIVAALQHESALRRETPVSSAATPTETAAQPQAAGDPSTVAPLAPRRRRWIWAAAGIAAAGLVATAVIVDRADAPVPATVAGGQWAGLQTIPVSTGTEYTDQNIDTLVPTYLRSRALPAAQAATVARTFAASESSLSACLNELGYAPDDLAMLDLARYGNRPVAVLAYLDGNGDTTADVVVVGTGCSTSQPDVQARRVTAMPQVNAG